MSSRTEAHTVVEDSGWNYALYLYTIGCATPYLMRLIESIPSRLHQIPNPLVVFPDGEQQGVSIGDLLHCQGHIEWSRATGDLGRKSFLIAAMRLFIWHLMQPVLYWLTLAAFWNDISEHQRLAGKIVAAREACYFLTVIILLCLQPVFLMVDIEKTSKEGNGLFGIGLYILSPEKYGLLVLLFGFPDQEITAVFSTIAITMSVLADIFGAAAFADGVIAGNLPTPLAIGYGVAALSALCWLVGWLFNPGGNCIPKINPVRSEEEIKLLA